MMTMVSERLSQVKESVFNLYKSLTIKPFVAEIVFWVRPKLDNSYYHFEKVAEIIDDRLIECTVGEQGEFIARYEIKTEKRDDATREAQEISDAIANILGGNFTFKQYQVK